MHYRTTVGRKKYREMQTVIVYCLKLFENVHYPIAYYIIYLNK